MIFSEELILKNRIKANPVEYNLFRGDGQAGPDQNLHICMLVTSTILLHSVERRHDHMAKLQVTNIRFHFESDTVVMEKWRRFIYLQLVAQ